MNKLFYFFDGNVVCVGDYVMGARGRTGRVTEIIQPNSKEASSYDMPQGGVFFEFDWGGIKSPLAMTPPDGIYWEDIEFIKREINGAKK